MKPTIDPAFWTDPDIEKQKYGVKLAALWLITNPATNILGVCTASASRFTFETGLPEEALQRALEGLPRAFKRIGEVILVKNYVRYQFGTGEKLTRNNFFVALKSAFLSVKSEELRRELIQDYPEFQRAYQALERGYEPQEKRREEKSIRKEGAGRKPTLEEVIEYGNEIGMTAEQVKAWYDHFESNGWRVSGKTPMRDWKAGLRNGKRNTRPANGFHAPRSSAAFSEPMKAPPTRPAHLSNENNGGSLF